MMKTPKFMSPAGYEAATEYVRQAKAYAESHSLSLGPDFTLLQDEALHGPITSVRATVLDKRPQIAASFHGRNERYFDPLDYAAITLGCALGMGLSIQDTGGDMGYPRFRPMQPKGQIIYVLRVLMNAGPWEVVKQHDREGVSNDYHHLSRIGLSKQPVQQTWSEGKASRVPWLGREAFFEAVALYWTKNHEAAGIGVSREAHLATIKTALALADDEQLMREPMPEY